MAKHLLLFRGGDDKMKDMSPDEMDRHMARWSEWVESMREKAIYQGGAPLKDVGVVVNPDQTISDGPFVETKEIIGGYIAVDVESLDVALAVAKECPILGIGGAVEVRPIAETCGS